MIIAALLGLMTLLLMTGLEIWVAIGLAALIPMAIFGLAPLEVLPQMMLSSLDSWVLLAVPFFILAGAIIAETSIGQRLVDVFNAIFGRLPGGLAISSVFTCFVFGGLTGSATAEAAGVTGIMAKPMERAGYPRTYVASLIASAGTMANLVPPSIALLI
jgi:C4-dicarboxylate transporter DctM subunit